MFERLLGIPLLLVGLTLGGAAVADDLLAGLRRAAPQLPAAALEQALAALRCAEGRAPMAVRLALIDYSRPSAERRLWLFDLAERRLLLHDFVAHGRESGEFLAERFSNRPGSRQSSLGLFRGAESYYGRHGYSLRLDGLEAGLNDQARARALVIHGADYVAAERVSSQGRIGRSLGCPAVRRGISRMLVDQLKDGQYLFAWHPEPRWLGVGRYRGCPTVSAARSAE